MISQVKLEKASAAIAFALRRITTEGGDGNFAIILADASKNYYAQFASVCGATGVYAELVGNGNVDPEYEISEERVNCLYTIGWEVGESGNFIREWEFDPPRVTPESIAREIEAILLNIYNIAPDQVIRLLA